MNAAAQAVKRSKKLLSWDGSKFMDGLPMLDYSMVGRMLC
jgi:hypothetical protein